MRTAGGDYARFLVRVSSPRPRTDRPTGEHSTPTRKPSRYGAQPMRRRESARVLGPYKEDALWRIIEIDARGRRKSYTVGSRQAATRLMARIRATLGARTVQATIELWGAARLRSGDAYPSTIADQSARVRALLGSVYKLRIGDVTERKALALYEQATQEFKQEDRAAHAPRHASLLSEAGSEHVGLGAEARLRPKKPLGGD